MKSQRIYQQHDHQHCIDSATEHAKTLCKQKGVQLTRQRELVLRLIWQSHRPLGAYALIEQLGKVLKKHVAPPTVYRALEFLSDLGLIHRIHSLNAFVGCPDPRSSHQKQFFICRRCGLAEECSSTLINTVINRAAEASDFTVENQSVEVMGLCGACRNPTNNNLD